MRGSGHQLRHLAHLAEEGFAGIIYRRFSEANLYRLSKVVGKPMTRVADDLMNHSFNCLKSIYSDLDDLKISEIIQKPEEEIRKSHKVRRNGFHHSRETNNQTGTYKYPRR